MELSIIRISSNSRLHGPLRKRLTTSGGPLLIFLISTHDQMPQQTVQLYSSTAHTITYLEIYLLKECIRPSISQCSLPDFSQHLDKQCTCILLGVILTL
jgi:hypothetical protein